MSSSNRELNNFTGLSMAIDASRSLLIVALIASLIFLLGDGGQRGIFSGNFYQTADSERIQLSNTGAAQGTVGIIESGSTNSEIAGIGTGANAASASTSAAATALAAASNSTLASAITTATASAASFATAPATTAAAASQNIRPDMASAEKILSGVEPLFAMINGDASGDNAVNANPFGSSANGTTPSASNAEGSSPFGGSVVNAFLFDGDPATAQIERSFPPIETFFTALGVFTSEVAIEHELLLDKRTYAISFAQQMSAAKYLAQAEYKAKLAERERFITEHGMSAADLSENDISKRYNNNYFTDRLQALGFYRNDKYGADVNRRNAIIRAQSAFNIPITARIDLNTKRALIEGSDYVPRDILPEGRPDGTWAIIDKSARILTVYFGGEVFMKFPVAVGSNISLTPEGKFTFVSKAVNPRWGGGGYAQPVAGGAPNNPLGKRWMGLSVGGGGSYGVHGNVNAYSIGTYASHGCVRMINSDVEFIYEYISIGTPIWIGTTAKLAEWGVYQQLGSWEIDPPDFRDFLPAAQLYRE